MRNDSSDAVSVFNRFGTILGSQRITPSLRHPPTTYPPPPSSPPGSLRCVLVDVLFITDYQYITVVCIMIPPSNRICNYMLPIPIATVNKETDHVSWCIYLFYMFLLSFSGFLCLTLLFCFSVPDSDSCFVFQCLTLPDEFKRGKLLAYQLLCQTVVRRHDVPLPHELLSQFYMCLHAGIGSNDQVSHDHVRQMGFIAVFNA